MTQETVNYSDAPSEEWCQGMSENGYLEVWVILAVDEKKHKLSETNESKLKVVGKSAAAGDRIVDVLTGAE